MEEITKQLVRISEGDQAALEALVPLVYDELKVLAWHHMRSERTGHTLSPTALVHEVYFKLAAQRHLVCQNRKEFFALSSCCMRRVLVNYARGRMAKKRGGGQQVLSLSDSRAPAMEVTFDELLIINDVLEKLGEQKARLPIIVDLMFFGGFKQQEIADTLGVSLSTVKKDWRLARAWLTRELNNAETR